MQRIWVCSLAAGEFKTAVSRGNLWRQLEDADGKAVVEFLPVFTSSEWDLLFLTDSMRAPMALPEMPSVHACDDNDADYQSHSHLEANQQTDHVSASRWLTAWNCVISRCSICERSASTWFWSSRCCVTMFRAFARNSAVVLEPSPTWHIHGNNAQFYPSMTTTHHRALGATVWFHFPGSTNSATFQVTSSTNKRDIIWQLRHYIYKDYTNGSFFSIYLPATVSKNKVKELSHS